MLTQILQELLDKIASGASSADKPLKHGLNILMRACEGGVLLTIWREVTDPGANEWNTVIAFWPYPIGAINWDESGVTESGRHYKQAFIKTT